MPITLKPDGALVIPELTPIMRPTDKSLGNGAYLYKYNESLFPEIPSSRHINQRRVGDCWFLSVLISILNFNVDGNGDPIDEELLTGPEIIMGMMAQDPTDNKRVVVRLYEQIKVQYISVKKSIPVIGNNIFSKADLPILSEGALWVTLLEKALAFLRGGGTYQVLSGKNQVSAFEYLLGRPVKNSVRASRIISDDSSHSVNDWDDFLLLMSAREDLNQLGMHNVFNDETIRRITDRFLGGEGTLGDHPWWDAFTPEVSNAWLSLLANKGACTWDPKAETFALFLQGQNIDPDLMNKVARALRANNGSGAIPIYKWKLMNYVADDLNKNTAEREFVLNRIFSGNTQAYNKWLAWYTPELREIWWRGTWWVECVRHNNVRAFDRRFLANAAQDGARWLKIEDVDFLLKAYNLPNRDQVISAIESKQLLARKRGAGVYSKRQLAMFGAISAALAADMRCVGCGTEDYVGNSSGGLPQGGAKGLVGGHAYSILETTYAYKMGDERPPGAKDEACFIRIRNPWGELKAKGINEAKLLHYGRGYVEKDRGDGMMVMSPVRMDAPEFWIELNDLDKRVGVINKGPVMTETPAYQAALATILQAKGLPENDRA